MKIALASIHSSDHDLSGNLEKMTAAVHEAAAAGADLVLFGESTLTGFDSINFNYAHDIKIALALRSPEISSFRKLARELEIAIGLGFIENEKGAIYSSYLVIDTEGEIADNYHRVSQGWRTPDACADYREGGSFHSFPLLGKRFTTLICGDFWEDDLLTAIVGADAESDCFLWPVHVNLPLERGSIDRREYRERTEILARPVLFVNNQGILDGVTYGGAFVWQQGRELAAHEPETPGILYYEL